MPVIHIRSLAGPKAKAVWPVEAVSRDFAAGAGVGLEHVTLTWESLAPEAYAHAGRIAGPGDAPAHPVLIDLLAPDFNTPARIESMLEALAASVARRAGVPRDAIFIHYRAARSGCVYDGGEIVHWPAAEGG